MKKLLFRLVALAVLAATVLSLVGCSGPLDAYEEDTEEGKSLYHVAIAVDGFGVIIVELDGEQAPKTVENFVKLVREDFYDGLTFHRVIENFMIQGGCPKGDGTGSSDQTVTGEFAANGWYNGIDHERGVISMARSNDFDSASCQFFICNADAPSLNGLYAAFGRVVEGMEVAAFSSSRYVLLWTKT